MMETFLESVLNEVLRDFADTLDKYQVIDSQGGINVSQELQVKTRNGIAFRIINYHALKTLGEVAELSRRVLTEEDTVFFDRARGIQAYRITWP